MPSRSGPDRDAAYVRDIVDSCHAIESYSRGKTLADFKDDAMLQDAIVRRLFIVGECAKGVTEGFRLGVAAIDWKNIGRLRDKLGHHYWAIEIDKIWEIVVDYVPVLRQALRDHPVLSQPSNR